jgi:CHASE2 domain-containing sensor protein
VDVEGGRAPACRAVREPPLRLLNRSHMNSCTVELFGFFAVAAMATCYALEPRSPRFILLFAGACLASSTYAVLIQSWPFAVVELLWTGIAARRWRSTVSNSSHG